ncbi:MAG: prkC 36 [Planctomycetota bacterium]|nr:prkC 36 [Planctomycetota bacterium]
MSRPNAEVPKQAGPPAPPKSPPGAAADTVAATAMFEAGVVPAAPADPTVQATMVQSPSLAPPGGDATIEVTNLAFPRINTGPQPNETVEMAPTFSGRRRPVSDGDTAATLDGDRRTNAFSMSSMDGSAEIVLNDLPRVTGYKLLSELGRGGMGVVYKARQDKLNRTVALKMVLAGAHASADQLERFMIEAQAVAHLKHNHIVQIYDVGELDGLPFFSLEYVDGGCLLDTIGGKPQPVGYAAKTVKILTEAMAFAHEQGIIHRDLKPANVLMTKAGEPKITDFGLAKRLEGNSQQTRDGAIMGTPSYMAPEQAWGLTSEIGPAADQHALGAILYEMLTGRPPYQGANPLDTLDQVRNQEPVPPTRLQPKVPKDLETISLKALQKDPKKRYATCKEMAEDLGRYVEGQPILARPVSAPERAYRWCKRNPRLAVAYGAVASLLVAAAFGSSAVAAVMIRKNSDLEIAKGKETVAKLAAEQREKEAKAIAMSANEQTNTMLEAQRYTAVLANMLLRDIPGTIEVRREMFKVALMSMDRATKEIEDLRKKGAGSAVADAMTLRTLAGIHQQRGIIYSEMPSKAALVWPEFDAMDKLAKEHFAKDPDDLEALKNMAASRLTLGDYTFKLKSDTATAEKYFLQAIEFRRKWLAKWPQDDTAKRAIANALGALAGMYQATGRPKDSVPLYEEEIQLRESVSVEMSREPEFQRELAGLYEKLGDLNMRLNDAEKGRTFYERSFEIRSDVVKLYPQDGPAQRDIFLSFQNMGHDYLIQRKEPKTARSYYQKAVDGFRERYKVDQTGAIPKGDLARALYFLGTACLEMNDTAAADAAYAESLPFRRELADSPSAKNDTTRSANINLMLGLARCNEHAEAFQLAEDLLKVPPANPYVYFQAACGYALCASAAERVKPDDKALAKKYRDSGFAALGMALKRGWKSAEEIATDPDLAPLRTDERFKPLLAEFQKAAAQK